MNNVMTDEIGAPIVVDRATFQAKLDALWVREKAHMKEGDAIAAARRRLPMVAVDGATPLIGDRGAVTLLDASPTPRSAKARMHLAPGTAISWALRCPGIRRRRIRSRLCFLAVG